MSVHASGKIIETDDEGYFLNSNRSLTLKIKTKIIIDLMKLAIDL